MMSELEIAKHNLKIASEDLRVTNALYLRGLAKPSELLAARNEYERCLSEYERVQRADGRQQ
jgi:outer membrane protein TolC